MLTSFSKHLEFHPLFYVFARFLQVGTAAFRMLWHLSSSTQSYGILITSLDTDCPSTGWPVGEKAKILPKNLLVERIWHCHGMTRLRASNTKLWFHFVQYWAIRLYFICMPCFVCIICWNGPPWFLPLGIVDPKNLKKWFASPKLRAAGCREHLEVLSIQSAYVLLANTAETQEKHEMLQALNDVKWEKII